MNYTKELWQGLWVVEWSEEQGFFHTQEADTRLAENIHNYLTGRPNNQYNTIGVFNSFKEATDFIQELTRARGLDS